MHGFEPENLKHLLIKHFEVNDCFRALNDYYNGLLDYEFYSGKADCYIPTKNCDTNLFKYIVDMNVNYSGGKKPTYESDNEKLIELLHNVDEANDFNSILHQLFIDQSIYGKAFLYVSIHDNEINQYKLNVRNTFGIYDELSQKPIAYCNYRFINDKDVSIKVFDKIATRSFIVYNAKEEQSAEIQELEEEYQPNLIGEIPIFELNNNFDSMGDFVNVIDLVNAYSSIQSTTLNDFEFFQNAILILKGYGSFTPEQMKELFKDRVWQIDENADAYYLNKTIPFEPQEAFKKRLLEDISLTSQTPLLKDEYFGGNASGVAFDYKLWAIEQKALLKENFTRTFLNQKIKYLKTIFRVFASDMDSQVKITFYRNAPKSKIEELNYLKGLVGITSNQTILENLSIVEDVQKEMERIEEESSVNDSFLNEPIQEDQI